MFLGFLFCFLFFYKLILIFVDFQVKAIPGLGTTVDVILVNGKLSEGETMIIAGTEGPITTQIRGLLMPQPMKELRVKVRTIFFFFLHVIDVIILDKIKMKFYCFSTLHIRSKIKKNMLLQYTLIDISCLWDGAYKRSLGVNRKV